MGNPVPCSLDPTGKSSQSLPWQPHNRSEPGVPLLNIRRKLTNATSRKWSPLRNQALATFSFSSMACTTSIIHPHSASKIDQFNVNEFSTLSQTPRASIHWDILRWHIARLSLPAWRSAFLSSSASPFSEISCSRKSITCTKRNSDVWHQSGKVLNSNFRQLTFWYLLDAISYFWSCNEAR